MARLSVRLLRLSDRRGGIGDMSVEMKRVALLFTSRDGEYSVDREELSAEAWTNEGGEGATVCASKWIGPCAGEVLVKTSLSRVAVEAAL